VVSSYREHGGLIINLVKDLSHHAIPPVGGSQFLALTFARSRICAADTWARSLARNRRPQPVSRYEIVDNWRVSKILYTSANPPRRSGHRELLQSLDQLGAGRISAISASSAALLFKMSKG
jgi:hypothetical protein